jgi:hypothetical protein
MTNEAMKNLWIFFLIIINLLNLMRTLEYGYNKLILLNKLVKNNISKIFEIIYHSITEMIIKAFLLLISIFFLVITIYAFLIIFLNYDVFSSMFFYKISAIIFFTQLSQGLLYYQSVCYSKDRLMYLKGQIVS